MQNKCAVVSVPPLRATRVLQELSLHPTPAPMPELSPLPVNRICPTSQPEKVPYQDL